MSAEGVTDACALVVATVPTVKAAYSSSGSGLEGTRPIPQDIPTTPVAIVRHNRFELAQAGSPERLVHYVVVELWVSATSAGEAERVLLPLVTATVAAFRTHVGIFGQGTVAKVVEGGPADDAVVSGKPYLVYPVTVRVTELSIQSYTL